MRRVVVLGSTGSVGTSTLDVIRTLSDRYRTELRPFVAGPESRHDLTLNLWLEAIAEERGP